jgi:hypothetical protein
MKARLFLLLVLFLFFVSSTAWGASPLLLSIQLFAPFQASITDQAGHAITDITPPVYEYKAFKEWLPEEVFASPDVFDGVAIISIPKGYKNIIDVHFEVSSKIGPLLEDPVNEMTDITAGHKAAKWEKAEIAKTIKLCKVRPGKTMAVYFKNINLKAIWTKYWTKNQWPYFIKVTAWLSCPGCDSSKKVSATAEIVPGD